MTKMPESIEKCLASREMIFEQERAAGYTTSTAQSDPHLFVLQTLRAAPGTWSRSPSVIGGPTNFYANLVGHYFFLREQFDLARLAFAYVEIFYSARLELDGITPFVQDWPDLRPPRVSGQFHPFFMKVPEFSAMKLRKYGKAKFHEPFWAYFLEDGILKDYPDFAYVREMQHAWIHAELDRVSGVELPAQKERLHADWLGLSALFKAFCHKRDGVTRCVEFYEQGDPERIVDPYPTGSKQLYTALRLWMEARDCESPKDRIKLRNKCWEKFLAFTSSTLFSDRYQGKFFHNWPPKYPHFFYSALPNLSLYMGMVMRVELGDRSPGALLFMREFRPFLEPIGYPAERDVYNGLGDPMKLMDVQEVKKWFLDNRGEPPQR